MTDFVGHDVSLGKVPGSTVANFEVVKKSKINMMITMGTVGKPGLLMVSPSMAEEILMAGVINPSEISVAHPIMARYTTHFALYRLTSAYRANIQPSPLLSAFSARYTYLTVVMSVSVQNTQETPPNTRSSVMMLSPTMALNTYSGEVPMSP